MKLNIYQVDAFADRVFSGNPAAVVPLEEWLEEDLMQQIASENNQSETAFFVKTDAGYHLRWFTPAAEIDLCGHATLASAYIIRNFLEPQLSSISFSTEKAGVLKASSSNGLYTLDFPSRMPEPCTPPDSLLKSICVSKVVEVLKSRDYFVVLPDEDAVKNVVPDLGLMKEVAATGVIVTAKGREADVVSRCFYPGLGINEDPVTGSAHCNIVPYWAAKLNKQQLNCVQLSKRRGTLICELKGDRVLMSGNCVLYMKGSIEI